MYIKNGTLYGSWESGMSFGSSSSLGSINLGGVLNNISNFQITCFGFSHYNKN